MTPPAAWLPRRTQLVADGGYLLAAAGAAGFLAWALFEYLDPLRIGTEQWFQADIDRVWRVLTDRYSGYHERSRIHPVFSLVNSTVVYGLRHVLGFDSITAVRVWLAATAAALAACCYVTARLMHFRTIDAVLVTCLVIASSSMLFWSGVPETKVVGALSILISIAAVALNGRWALPDWALVLVCAVSLSMTSSNVMAGLAALVVLRPFRRAVQLSINAFFLVSVLQVIQNAVFWTARGMTDLHGESRFVLDRSAGGMLSKLIVSLFHSLLVPRVKTPIEFDTHTPMISVQQTGLLESGTLYIVAAILWTGLLVWGISRAWTHRREAAPAACLLTVSAQVAFHLVYGDQTFLYTLHFLPLLCLLAAGAIHSSRPLWGRGLVIILLAVTVANNVHHLNSAKHQLDQIAVPGGPQGPPP